MCLINTNLFSQLIALLNSFTERLTNVMASLKLTSVRSKNTSKKTNALKLCHHDHLRRPSFPIKSAFSTNYIDYMLHNSLYKNGCNIAPVIVKYCVSAINITFTNLACNLSSYQNRLNTNDLIIIIEAY